MRYRKRSPKNSLAGAKAYELLLRQRIARGEPLNGHEENQGPPVPTFKEFSEKWYETYVCTNNKPSEQKAKRVTLRAHLLPCFGPLRLDDISGLEIEEYKAAK